MSLINVGILGLSQRVGRFNELGLRSWEESGCAEMERCLLAQDGEKLFFIHRPLVIRAHRKQVTRLLRDWCDAPHVPSRCDLILTVAGTGTGPDDIMPEATGSVIQRPLPGVAETVRISGLADRHPEAALSRGVAGIRRRTLIINVPGPSPALIKSAMGLLTPMLPALVEAVQSGNPV